MMRRLVTHAILTLAASVVSAEDLPTVTSVNVCTDQYVMLLADPGQVSSISALSEDPFSSALAERAGDFAKNSGRAEAIALDAPDIVVAHDWTDPALLNMLRTIGIEVVQFPTVTALADIPAQLRRMGEVLNRESVAEDMAATFEARLEQFPEPDSAAPLAAFFYPNGYALGAGTLSHDILSHAGARNLSVELGLRGGGKLALEQVVLHQPDLLIAAPRYDGFSQSEDMTTHPALSEIPVIQSSRDWSCGTPRALDAVADVARAIDMSR